MSIINDALKKANNERNPANFSSTTVRWIGLIIILTGLIASSYFISLRERKEKAVEITTIPIPKDTVAVSQDPVPEEPPHETEPLPNLTGIIRGEGKLLAVINNNIVEEGQTIGGMRVKKIYNDHVVLSDNAKEYIITLK
jgi:hypothetical protein